MRLPYDICRCHDEDCPQREDCLRWLDRKKSGARTSHVDTMRPWRIGEKCLLKIGKETEKCQ
jgi:hypothetical protein